MRIWGVTALVLLAACDKDKRADDKVTVTPDRTTSASTTPTPTATPPPPPLPRGLACRTACDGERADGTTWKQSCGVDEGCSSCLPTTCTEDKCEAGCLKKLPEVGAACARQDEAECANARMIVTCDAGHFIEYPCKGPEGCGKHGLLVRCDESHGDIGDGCSHDDNYACSTDGTMQIRCDARKWVLNTHCRGPQKCVPEGLYVKCDQTVAQVGDACQDFAAACSVDNKAVLECSGGTYAVKHQCTDTCTIENKIVQCKPDPTRETGAVAND